MKLIFLMIAFLIFCISIGALCSVVIFAFDVFRWHSQEKRLQIVPSAQELPDEFKDIPNESEVKDDARSDSGSTSEHDSANDGEPDSPVVFSSWLQS